jgi:hypothetical protein
LRAGIARERSYVSILVIPQRKMRLCEALHGRRPWPSSRSINGGMVSSRERKGREGERSRGARLGVAWGRGGTARSSLTPAALRVRCSVREKKKIAGRRREEKRRERSTKGKKRK